MDQEADHVKRIAELEAALATEKKLHYLATRLIGERDARLEQMGGRVSELEAALEERDAIMATVIKVTRHIAFGEAAQVLLKLAHGARPMGLAEAAKVVADMANSDKPLLAKDFTEESIQAKGNP